MNNDHLEGDFEDPVDGAADPTGGVPAPSPSRLVTAAEAADMLCISEATLWELVKRDRLQCVEFIATGFRRPIRRFRIQDLIQFIEESVG
jgi:hypothetical protein